MRSPLPLLLAGLLLAVALIVAVSLRPAHPPANPDFGTTLSDREALTLVAQAMRSGVAARQVLDQGHAHFTGGVWQVTVGAAQFHFSPRNQVIVPDNQDAISLEFGS